jgi:hypothetical protein
MRVRRWPTRAGQPAVKPRCGAVARGIPGHCMRGVPSGTGIPSVRAIRWWGSGWCGMWKFGIENSVGRGNRRDFHLAGVVLKSVAMLESLITLFCFSAERGRSANERVEVQYFREAYCRDRRMRYLASLLSRAGREAQTGGCRDAPCACRIGAFWLSGGCLS